MCGVGTYLGNTSSGDTPSALSSAIPGSVRDIPASNKDSQLISMSLWPRRAAPASRTWRAILMSAQSCSYVIHKNAAHVTMNSVGCSRRHGYLYLYFKEPGHNVRFLYSDESAISGFAVRLRSRICHSIVFCEDANPCTLLLDPLSLNQIVSRSFTSGWLAILDHRSMVGGFLDH